MSAYDLRFGDCEEILPNLPTASCDSVLSDPPYGVDIAEWDKFPPPEKILRECLRISTGSVVWFGGAHPRSMRKFLELNPDRILVWHVTFSLRPAVTDGIYYKWHPIYCWRLPKQEIISRDVLEFPTAKNNSYDHPAKKPQALMELLVSAFGGTSVLDPFMGSGTTGAACMRLGKDFVGIEKDEIYFEMSQRRLAEAENQLVMF